MTEFVDLFNENWYVCIVENNIVKPKAKGIYSQLPRVRKAMCSFSNSAFSLASDKGDMA